jgi:hypothetical protein
MKSAKGGTVLVEVPIDSVFNNEKDPRSIGG